MEHILTVIGGTMQSVRDAYYTYCGVSTNLTLLYLALFYLLCSLRQKTDSEKQDRFFLWLTALLTVVIIFPVTAWIIMKYCVESAVYRRMFWMIPVPLLVGYVGAKVVSGENTRWRKIFVGALLTIIIAATGVSLYTPEKFTKAGNAYKLYPWIPEVCDAIEADAAENGIDDIGAITIDDFAVQLRQYDAAIRMPYGRNAFRGETLSKLGTKIYQAMHKESMDVRTISFYAKQGNYQYLVCRTDKSMLQDFYDVGYELAAEVG